MKKESLVDIKTGNSQQSNIDQFSRLECSFLEKFFKYNLIDYFSHFVMNVHEEVLKKKASSKLERNVGLSFFFARQDFEIDRMESEVNEFYKSKSRSIGEDLPCAFSKAYCNNENEEFCIREGEAIFVDVRIKTEVEKVEELPNKIFSILSSFKNSKKGQQTELENVLTKYKSEYLNIFCVYFGDINFGLFRKDNFLQRKIELMGRVLKLRIYVFFVSKQGLVETFRSLNKIENLEYINDLVIQFYELKREKNHRKKLKMAKQEIIQSQKKIDEKKSLILGAIGLIGLLAFGISIKKLYFDISN